MINVHEINQSILKKLIRGIFNKFGFEIKKKDNWYDRYKDSVVELNPKLKKIITKSSKFINASIPNRWAIIQSLEHVKKNKIKGDIVETGVFHGGGLILINDILKYLKLKKKIWGYDTFEGIPNQSLKHDRILGNKSINKKETKQKINLTIYPEIDTVKKNLKKNGFLKIPKLVQGDTKKTLKIKKNLPKKISFLRLDTDFYESTLNELKIFFPLLSKNGILLIDDYGHHSGCKKAVDKYFKNKNVWLHRIDYTARLIIK